MNKLLMTLLITLMLSPVAYAMDLDAAKRDGLVGEGNNGYLAYVVKPPSAEVMALVKQVNNLRRDKFTASATRYNLSVDQVASRFYERANKETEAGNYIQTPAGDWRRK